MSAPANWGFAVRTAPGQSASGDRYFFLQRKSWVRMGIIDALGHGIEASRVAEQAVRFLEDRVDNEPFLDSLTSCHTGLRGTRGVAMGLVEIDLARAALAWKGVGNVMACISWTDPQGAGQVRELPCLSGVVGGSLPRGPVFTQAFPPGARLALATDGVRRDFVNLLPSVFPPGELAELILRRCFRGTDDALVVVLGNTADQP